MSKNKYPAMPFDTRDWLCCPELKVLAPDVRGLWMDMLCYMWESPECGVLLKPNGDPISKDEASKLLGLDASESHTWIDKLIDNHLCSVRADGALYSRKMVRNHEISLKRTKAGRRGGITTRSRISAKAEPVEVKPAPMTNIPEPKNPPVQDSPEENILPPPEPTPEEKAKAANARKYKYADNVTLTREEYIKLVEQYSEEDVKGIIGVLDNYKGQNGKRYRSDYRAILNWVINAYYEKRQKYGNNQCRTVVPGAEQTGGFGTGTTL